MNFKLLAIFALLTILLGSTSLKNEMKIISYPEFEQMLSEPSEQIRIFNFWATWCAPCIKEMPHFEKVSQSDPGLKLSFISLDDGRKPERVSNFIEKRKISSPVYLLDDIDYNKWISKVHEDWSGAIPATLVIDAKGKKHFYEGEMSEEELLTIINKLK